MVGETYTKLFGRYSVKSLDPTILYSIRNSGISSEGYSTEDSDVDETRQSHLENVVVNNELAIRSVGNSEDKESIKKRVKYFTKRFGIGLKKLNKNKLDGFHFGLDEEGWIRMYDEEGKRYTPKKPELKDSFLHSTNRR